MLSFVLFLALQFYGRLFVFVLCGDDSLCACFIFWIYLCTYTRVLLCVRFFRRLFLFVRGWVAAAGFEYREENILGVNAASKWSQELAELNLAIKATPFYLGYKDAGLIGVSCVAQDNHFCLLYTSPSPRD